MQQVHRDGQAEFRGQRRFGSERAGADSYQLSAISYQLSANG